MLSETEKRHLAFILENPRLLIPWKDLPEYSDKALESLHEQGQLNPNGALTMRGVCHLVVDCNVPFSRILQTFARSFEPMKSEIDKAKRILETEDHFNIFYHYNFKQYLEWDMFNERHGWKRMEQKELLKAYVQIGLKLIDDGRIPFEKFFDLLGVPKGLMNDMKMSKEQAKYVLQTTLSYL